MVAQAREEARSRAAARAGLFSNQATSREQVGDKTGVQTAAEILRDEKAKREERFVMLQLILLN